MNDSEKIEASEMNENKEKSTAFKKVISIIAFVLAMIFIVSIPVAAWLMTQLKLASYAPISAPQSLYIGAGHIHFADSNDPTDTDEYEEIRYLHLNGIDVEKDGIDHYDYVFCIYGKAIQYYKIQLAFTTNNQFSYRIFNATESSVYSEGAVAYTTHDDTPTTYYYSINGAAISGSFLNDSNSDGIADSSGTYHTATYDSYSNINQYGEPLYWKTSAGQEGNLYGSFVNYYILRVSLNSKSTNDRETDIICIAAKSSGQN